MGGKEKRRAAGRGLRNRAEAALEAMEMDRAISPSPSPPPSSKTAAISSGAAATSRAAGTPPSGSPNAPAEGETSPVPRGARARVRYPIGLKLVVIITSTIALALSAMIFLASYFFRQDATIRIEENNHQTAKLLAIKVEGDFRGQIAKVRLLLSRRPLSVPQGGGAPRADGAARLADAADFFAASPETLFVELPGLASYLNASKAAAWGFDRSAVDRALLDERGAVEAGRSEAVAVNLSPYFGRAALGLVVPYVDADYKGSLIVGSDVEGLLAALKPEGIGYSFAVNGDGRLLLHPDATQLSGEGDLSRLPIVEAMLRGKADNGQTIYEDRGIEYLGSYRRTSFAGVGVVSVAPSSLAFEAVDRIERRNLYIMGAVLSLAVLAIYFFSRTISRPVGALMGAARLVEEGRYSLDLVPTTRDELGALTTTFVEMGRGLEERERMKDTLGKFVNKDIAERALRGELELGGERKRAVVLFSDVRGFTAMSESLEPEAVVEFLNEYLSLMVGCIERTGGIVDKFIGDAIMAVWGLPEPAGGEEMAAVEAALLMRTALAGFNEGRGGPGRPRVRTGCAINAGQVLAGQIGSQRRMEYTVIGDAVNLASRIEALTKPFGVDILVSESMREALDGSIRLAPMPLVSVKGKSAAQRVFAVLGRTGDESAPRDAKGLRARLGVEDRELDAERVYDGEEQKFSIEGKPKR